MTFRFKAKKGLKIEKHNIIDIIISEMISEALGGGEPFISFVKGVITKKCVIITKFMIILSWLLPLPFPPFIFSAPPTPLLSSSWSSSSPFFENLEDKSG